MKLFVKNVPLTQISIILLSFLLRIANTYFKGFFNLDINTSCPMPLGSYTESCSASVFLDEDYNSQGLIPYKLEDIKFPICRFEALCLSYNGDKVYSKIEYPPYMQFISVENIDGKLHQQDLSLQTYSSSILNTYNLIKREQIAVQRQQDAFNRGRLLEDIKNNKVALRKT